MAIVKRMASLSRLAFFVSLGIAAAIVNACSSNSDEDNNDPNASKGGSGSTGGSGTGGVGMGTSGTASTTEKPQSTQVPNGAGGTLHTIDISTENNNAGQGGLWDVIYE